jgi:hypothetical protein
MSKDSGQTAKPPKQFRLTHLGNLNQVIKALGKTIRAMADDSLDSQKGARICAGLGILRGCLEIKELQEINRKLDQMQDVVERRRNGNAGYDRPLMLSH